MPLWGSGKTQASHPLPPPAEEPREVEPLLGGASYPSSAYQQSAQYPTLTPQQLAQPSGYQTIGLQPFQGGTSPAPLSNEYPGGLQPLQSGFSSGGLQPFQSGFPNGGFQQPLQSGMSPAPLNPDPGGLQPLQSGTTLSGLGSTGSQLAPLGSPGTQPTPSTAAKVDIPVEPFGQLMVQELKAEGLKPKGAICKSTLCTCELGSSQKKPHSRWATQAAKNSSTPEWTQSHLFETFNRGDSLILTITEKALCGQTKLGTITLAFDRLVEGYYAKVRLVEGLRDAKPLLTLKLSVKAKDAIEWRYPVVMDVPPDLPLEPLATDTGATLGQPQSANVGTSLGTGGVSTASNPDTAVVNQLLAGTGPSQNTLQGQSLQGPLGQPNVGTGLGSASTLLGSTAPLTGPMGQTIGGAGLGSAPPSRLLEGRTPEIVPPNAFLLREVQQKDALTAVGRWMRRWESRRCIQLDPYREKNKTSLQIAEQPGVPGAQDRMFVFRLRNAIDISVPLSADSRVPKTRFGEARKNAEKEALLALSLRLRFSFLDAPAGLAPALYGHSILSPKLRIEKAEVSAPVAVSTSCFGGGAPVGLGVLKVTAVCDVAPFFFCSNTTGSDRQLVVEVLAEMEPLVVNAASMGERAHTVLVGEGIRVRADGYTQYRDQTQELGGGIAYIVDLKTASGNIAMRWAPLLDGEHVMRNATVNGVWATPDLHGGWPHHSALGGGPVLLDFIRAKSGWEVWVDGERQPEFDFKDRSTPIDVVDAAYSKNLVNAQVFFLPSTVTADTRVANKLPSGTTSRTQPLMVPRREWCVDAGVAATARPKSAPRSARGSTPQNVKDPTQNDGTLIGTREPVAIGWMCVRFDNATESGSLFTEQLILGSLQEWLLPYVDPKTGQPKPSTNNLQDYLQRVQGRDGVGSIGYDLERVQMSPVAQKLLPLDFTARVGMARLGGISSKVDKKFLALSAADEASCLLKDFCVTLPDGKWLEDFRNAIEFNVDGKMDKLAGDQKQVREFCLKVGSHNCLRWLDLANKAYEIPELMRADELRGRWKLGLAPDAGQQNWMFPRGEPVPLEFACDVDCALVFELVAVVVASKPGGMERTQNQTIGWLLLLPLVHTTEEALEKATAAATLRRYTDDASVQYNMELIQQMDPISGQKAFRWKPIAAGQQPMHNAVRISFSISGDAFIRWLQRKCAPMQVPDELKSRQRSLPLTQPGLSSGLLPGPMVGQQFPGSPTFGGSTMDLTLKPPALVPPSSFIPTPAVTIPMVTQPPWVHPVTQPQPGIPGMPQPGMPPVLPQELQTVVERIYMRDQGTQSDPPPIPGMEDSMIGEGRALPAAMVAALASSSQEPTTQKYTGPSMRPLPGGTAARLIQDVGDVGANAILRGFSYLKSAGGPRRELRWRLEDDDPLQADEITVEFLAYRNFSSVIAERVHFQLRLFVFPPLKTSSAILAGGVGEACMLRSAVTNDRLALVYNVDGATKGTASQVHRQLTEYLAGRSAEVEVWNTDSAMQVGAATVPLEPLVRQGQQVAKVEGEFPVLDPMTGETRGSLQMLLACRGRAPARAVPGPAQPPLQATTNASMMPEVSELGATMVTAAGSATAAVREAQAERGRIRRHKAQVLLGTNPGPSTMPSAVAFPDDAAKKRHRLKQLRMIRGSSADLTERFSEHTALLSAAEEVRADRKRAEVARRMDRFNTSQFTLPAAFAHSAFFHVEFANPYSQQAAFIVSITEPQKPPGAGGPPTTFASSAVGVPSMPPQSAAVNFQGILQQPPEEALVLVKDPGEWQRLAAEKQVAPPPSGEYGIFSALGHFSLRPGESTSLPFRFLAFNHPSLATAAQQAPVGGISLHDAETQNQEVPDRIFIIEVLVHQGPPLKRVEVTVRAQPCVVDKTVRFFEAEGEAIEKSLALPSRPAATAGFLRGIGLNTTAFSNQSSLGQAGLFAAVGRPQDRFVYCTDKEVHLQWKDDDTLQLRMLTPMSPAVRRFFVLCYADANFMRVGAAQLVEVHAMKCEHIRVCVGQSVDRTISLPPVELLDTPAVTTFSSDPDLVAIRQAAAVDPRYGAKLALVVTAMRAGTRTCRLHATDPMTRRRIAAFLIVVAADMPDVRMAHDITLPLNRVARKHLKYTNETMRALRYIVKSSDPALATVQTPELMLPPGDTRVIELLFHAYPGNMSYSTEVYLFITSEDRAIQETRLLQLTYT